MGFPPGLSARQPFRHREPIFLRCHAEQSAQPIGAAEGNPPPGQVPSNGLRLFRLGEGNRMPPGDRLTAEFQQKRDGQIKGR